MAKLILRTYKAQRNEHGGGFGVVFNLTGAYPLPCKTVEINTVADAAAELEAYKKEAAALNVPLVVTMSMERGHRAPRGFKALNKDQWHPVNV